MRRRTCTTSSWRTLPRSAIDELRENDADLGDNTLADVVFPVILDDVPASLTNVIPPSWLQEQVEQVLDQFGGYMAGKRDDFEINVPLRDRATALSQEVRLFIPYATLYDHVMDDLVKPGIDEALEDKNAAPFNAPNRRGGRGRLNREGLSKGGGSAVRRTRPWKRLRHTLSAIRTPWRSRLRWRSVLTQRWPKSGHCSKRPTTSRLSLTV